MKKRAFFINDIQDYWLFNQLVRVGDDIFYNTTNKITSPHRSLSQLEQSGLVFTKFISWREIKQNFTKFLEDYDYFITKECHPFTSLDVPLSTRISPSPVKDKTFSIGWVGESIISHPPGDSRYNIKDKFLYHFIEPQLIPIYKNLGFGKNIIGNSPKYYFLNSLNRKSACQLFGLDHTKKYATILVTKAHEPTLNEDKILDHIIQYCNKNDIEVIFKTKMKYLDFYRDKIKHQYFFPGDNWMFHQTLALMMISHFVIGFSSAAALEAEAVGVPFINFWKTEDHDREYSVDEQDLGFLHENFHRLASKARRNWVYRLAQSENIFNIKASKLYEYSTIRDALHNFLELAHEPIQVQKFDVHPLWNQIY